MMRSVLREHDWILGGCHTIRAVTGQCQACRRFKTKKLESVPNPLPEDRVREAKVFEVLGMDLAGPLYVKTGGKEVSKDLKDIDEVGTPDLDMIESKNLDKRLRYRANLREQLLGRFRNEYFGQLKMQLPKLKSREIMLDEIVLIGSDNKKRCDWPLARVIELLPGKDGRTRLVRKTQSGVLLRPIQRLYPLEVVDHQQIVEGKLPSVMSNKHDNSLEDTKSSLVKVQQDEKRLSRYGRVIKVPDRLMF
ncbi:hypothetical protein JTE90_020154 [Oedothorax gibbosus]|uniref:DUF5641 domain-containing protein n=1 Tax=Oedothorax gibbosus TaxID=931172 RepID=A0AAV6TT63_9ARAC|nr:hypothetical protein JTE90_020154 [Oedothorax gibbosus]